MSTYPERCDLALERRTIPGESSEKAVREISDAFDRVRARRPGFSAEVRLNTAQAPSDVPVDAPIVERLRSALEAEGMPVAIEGLSAWTEAALLNEAGIPAVCFGPGDISLAHAAEEYVLVSEIRRATSVLATVATNWFAPEPR